jgi:hypothetical protein
MKRFRDLLIEAKGLKKIKRLLDKTPSNKNRAKVAEEQRKFAARQAARAAQKYGSEESVKTSRMTKSVPSFRAIGAQFGVDVSPDASGQYGSSNYTPTEDKALSGNMKQDKEAQNTFKKTFLSVLSRSKKLGSS